MAKSSKTKKSKETEASKEAEKELKKDEEAVEATATEESKTEETKTEENAEEKTEEKKEKPKTDAATSNPWWKFWTWPKKKLIPALIGDAVVLFLILFFLVPAFKYGTLNLVSDADLNVTVMDAKTEQPIEGVEVKVGQLSDETDENGQTTLNGVGYGEIEVMFSKDSYKPTTEYVTVDSSSFSIDSVQLAPTGTPFTFTITDQISGQAINEFEVSIDGVDDSTVMSDETGVATLNVPNDTGETFQVLAAAEGYNSQIVSVKKSDGDSTTALLKSGRVFFISDKSGNVDVVSTNYDGSDRQTVVSGVGTETPSRTYLYVTPDNKYGVLNAPRADDRDEDGDLRSELYVVDLESGEIELFDEGAEWWSVLHINNDRVVYQLDKGDAELNDNRKVKTYTFSTKKLESLVAKKRFDGIAYVDGSVLIGSSNYVGYPHYEYRNVEFFSVDVETGVQKGIESNRRVWTIHQTARGVATYFFNSSNSNDDGWARYNVNTNTRTSLETDPVNPYGRRYIDSANGQRSAWIENRDGGGRIIIGDSNGQNGEILDVEINGDQTDSFSGISRWVGNDHIIIKSSNNIYIVHIESGKAIKVGDTPQYQNIGDYRYYYYY